MKPKGPARRPCHRLFSAIVALACNAALAASSPAPSPVSAPPDPAQLIQQGDAQVKARHIPEALALFEQAAQFTPDDPAILLRISQQCDSLIPQAKSPAEAQAFATRALDLAKKAVALAPDNPKAHLALAVAYGRLTDFVDNRTKIEYSRYIKDEAAETIQLDPNEDYAYHVLGRWNYGVATLSPVLKLMARYIYGGLPDASLEDAVRDFKKAIAIAPQRIIHHHELARAYVALGQLDDARKEWQTELNLTPEDHESEQDQAEARSNLQKN